MKCYNCNKNAMFLHGPKGQQTPLCLDCYIRLQNVMLQQEEMYERQINYLTAEMESSVGMPGIFPRFPKRQPIIHTGDITLNNIHVSNSEVGVLNTGTIKNVDTTVTVLKNEGNAELATAVTALSEAVIKSGQITNNQKDQILELLSSLSSEAVVPKENRKSAVAKALLSELLGILGGITEISDIWKKAHSIFQQIFGI